MRLTVRTSSRPERMRAYAEEKRRHLTAGQKAMVALNAMPKLEREARRQADFFG